MSLFGWMNDQLLRMVWLNDLVAGGVRAAGLDPASQLGGSVQFFVYDVIKIFALLSVLIFTISWVQSHFPPERTRALLGGRSGLGANTMAALLGTLTPFCSCSSIPLFIGFTAAGLPLAVTFSFLISSPLVDLASVILLASIFNWPIALAYGRGRAGGGGRRRHGNRPAGDGGSGGGLGADGPGLRRGRDAHAARTAGPPPDLSWTESSSPRARCSRRRRSPSCFEQRPPILPARDRAGIGSLAGCHKSFA
ncbi:permease [Cereibacter sediminicola]|uniref:permease n=1 Tax=Cereibacter sediminicola TaxID=2584941 RepID=UPI003CCC620D